MSKLDQINIAIQKLRTVIGNMDTRQFQLKERITDANNNIRFHLGQDQKKLAMNQLKMRKTFEHEIESLDGMKFNLEHKILSLEQAILQQEMIESSRMAKSAMESVYVINNMDENLDLYDDLQDELQQSINIGNALAERQYDLYEFDDSIMDELDELFEEVENEKAEHGINEDIDIVLPNVPTHPPEKNDEISKLRARLLNS